jgi:protein TonB
MKKLILLNLLMGISMIVFAQDKEVIYAIAQTDPQYVGGSAELYKYLAANIKYPEAAKANKIEGKVFAKIEIKKDGSIGEINLLKKLSPECDEETIRVLKSMPKWIPGKNNNKAVNTYYILPIVFKI